MISPIRKDAALKIEQNNRTAQQNMLIALGTAVHEFELVSHYFEFAARPLDTSYNLQATNGIPAGFPQNSTVNSYYLVAPANTTLVRYQVTMRVVGGSGGILYDAMRLSRKTPVAVTSSVSGGNLNLSWPSQCATSYQVVYKNSLTDTEWTPVGAPVAGDGSVKTASFPTVGAGRFYRVQTL